ncbi:MAG: hypothetical protein KF865_07465 [Bdellovibrionaceae bacterium]|nr:hypothetical protein [Pseudobdellovibrionaceae bacterium]
MRQKPFRFASVIVAALLLSVSFQNCGKAGFDGQDPLSLDLSSSDLTGTPFAFDATFDQISYNSCAASNLAGYSGFYTLMAGAYQSGGVWTTAEFKNYMSGASAPVKPIYPATTLTVDQIKQHLASTPENVEAIPQMALRLRTNIQQVRTPNSSGATEGLDYISMLGDLTDDRWMHPLVNDPGSALFFNLAPNNARRLEARLTYNKDEGLAKGLRMDLSSSSVLALTFRDRADMGDATRVRVPYVTKPDGTVGPTGDSTVGFGRGYYLTFDRGLSQYTRAIRATVDPGSVPVPHTLNPDNLLTEIREVNLRTPSAGTTATWACPESRRYVVVQPGDADQYCPQDPFVYMNDPAYRLEYEIVRRHLKSENWRISIQYRCVVPIEGSCYVTREPSGAAPMIEYDQTQPCYQSVSDVSYGNPIPTKRCAQYVSFCNRN